MTTGAPGGKEGGVWLITGEGGPVSPHRDVGVISTTIRSSKQVSFRDI